MANPTESKLNYEKYISLARRAAAEGCVLLKNDKQTLPLKKGTKVAVFGRCAFHYYKSGLGSGGLVNTRYVVSILDAMKSCKDIELEESVLQVYEEWLEENPADEGHGWGTIPWSQKEMPLSEEVVKVAHQNSDTAIVFVGRTAGEDQDNSAAQGSYLLTETEEDMIAKVCKEFDKTVVLLNVGNIIDMSWVEKYHPTAVMYVWQGGQEGGNGVLDVLTGTVNPSGKLSDTIAYDIADYPSTETFGDQWKNYYREDIYVGYRYFETFAKEKVQYPFGFGLSYTTFSVDGEVMENTASGSGDRTPETIGTAAVTVKATVKNTGSVSGREVVQVYIEAPQGKLGKPARVLAGFAKTKELAPGEEQELLIACPKSYFASYDDSGATNHKAAFLLEAGKYQVYVGSDVRSAVCVGNWEQSEEVLEQCEEACAPLEVFERMKPTGSADAYSVVMEQAPLRTVSPTERIARSRAKEKEISYTGSQGYLLRDVAEGRVSMEQFVAQLSDEDLMSLFHGEGMCSLKVTPGTAGAFGGLTESLRKLGIPAICCADGPSGIRMDCGTEAFSLPNGTLLGCTFHLELVQELFEQVGWELRKNKVDTLLGPGINIHRNPLNGRNFEYISEDPLLTGKMGAVQLLGMNTSGATGTIKHYCANNQEKYRTSVEAVVSERALREIYLKGYEISVKEGDARSIMTTYGPVNGINTAGSFDLCTHILRDEWGFKGIVMTDWWATSNWEGERSNKTNRAPMVIAQNDLYMCCTDTLEEIEVDNVRKCLEEGKITRSDLQRNAKNLLQFILESPAMAREMGVEEPVFDSMGEDTDADAAMSDDMLVLELTGDIDSAVISAEDAGRLWENKANWCLTVDTPGEYTLSIRLKSESGELAQIPISVYADNLYRMTISIRGTAGEWKEFTENIGQMSKGNHYMRLVHKERGISVDYIKISRK